MSLADQGAPGPTSAGRPRTTASARLRRFGVRVCVLYTVLTVVSSSWALFDGRETDTHLHLLVRLVFVLVGLGAFEAVDLVRSRSTDAPGWLIGVVAYLAALAAILSGLWVFAATGGQLHPDAYRDAFWNFTAVGVGVAVVLIARGWVRGRRRR